MMKKWLFFLFLVFILVPATSAFAEVITTFDEGSLNPNVSLDIPNAGLAAISLDTVNEELDFSTTGNTDLWGTRNNAPFAWTSRPPVNPGDTWIVETELRYNTDVLSAKWRVAGITFYGGPDGSGGSNNGMDFTFGINNWDDRGDPGYQASVEVQGLGDNLPGDAAGNLTVLWNNPSVFLRVEITENGASDAYAFFYKANSVDPWTSLGTFNSTVDNSRAALFFKNSGITAVPDRSSAFTYFNVWTAQCTADADCDDGVFCNGTETCDSPSATCVVVSACPPVTLGCVTLGGFCNEVSNMCEDVADDGQCLAGEICDINTGNCIQAAQAVSNIPTMNQWGMVIFLFLAGCAAVVYLRRRRKE